MAALTASQILGIFSTKDWKSTEDSAAQFSCTIYQRWSAFVACLALTFRSSSSRISSTGFKSADCAVMFLFAFNVDLAGFTSMIRVIILHEYESLTNMPRSRWDRVMLLYTVIIGPIQLALHLVQIPDFAIAKISPHNNRATTMLYDWY